MSSSRVERCEGISIRPVRVKKTVRPEENTDCSDYSRNEIRREKSDKEKLEESLDALEYMLLIDAASNY